MLRSAAHLLHAVVLWLHRAMSLRARAVLGAFQRSLRCSVQKGAFLRGWAGAYGYLRVCNA
eukprot:14847292-Alexandrium_andersonii.AAC.1